MGISEVVIKRQGENQVVYNKVLVVQFLTAGVRRVDDGSYDRIVEQLWTACRPKCYKTRERFAPMVLA